MQQRLSRPNAGPQSRTIQVDGVGEVQVSPNFFGMSPDQQQQVISEITADYGSQHQAAPQAAQAQGSLIAPGTAGSDPLSRWGESGVRFFSGAAQGAGHVLDNSAELLQDGYNATLGRVFGESHSATEANQGGSDYELLINPNAQRGGFEGLANNLPEGSSGGRLAGEILASAVLTRGLPGPITQGAGAGLVMSDSDTAGGRLRDAGIGAIGGHIGNRVARLGQAVIAPQVNEAARRLFNRDIHITPGQASDRLRRWEERRTSRPFLGDQIIQGRQQGYRDFNRVALEDVVAPVNNLGGAPIRVPANLGNDAVRHVGNEVSARYERLVPRLSMRPDADLANDITGIAANVSNGNLSPAALRQFQTILQNQVRPLLNGAGPIAGPQFRQIERRLGGQVARFGRSTDPDHQAMAEAFGEMQSAFQRALQRSNPQHARELAALNESWANLVRVEDAAGRAAGGLFSPGQFRQAVRRGDRSVRNRAMARGEARMQQLADDAADVLPSQYPDSGTAGRTQDNLLDPRFYLGWAEGRMYTPQVQRGLTRLMMHPRPQSAQSVADLLGLLPAPQAGAAAGLGLTGPLFR
jgi:hypothetical protein